MENLINRKMIFQIDENVKERFATALRFICMALFLYTAYAKIFDHERFLNGLSKVHIINGFAVYVSYFVPISEVIIAILLLIPQSAKLGLYAFICLMVIFTVYIISALVWEKDLPCSCGGAIEKLSWIQHIWFNLAFIIMAVFAFWLNNQLMSLKNK